MDYDRLERQVNGLLRIASARAQRLTTAIGQMAKKHQPLLASAIQSMTAEAKKMNDEVLVLQPLLEISVILLL
jgi:hypothetical protein